MSKAEASDHEDFASAAESEDELANEPRQEPGAAAGGAEETAAHDVSHQASVDEDDAKTAAASDAKAGEESTLSSDELKQRQAGLDQVDRTKAKLLEEGVAGKSLFDRFAAKEEPQQSSGGWGWGGWASTAWSQASHMVNTVSDAAGRAALSLLEDEEEAKRAAEQRKASGGGDDTAQGEGERQAGADQDTDYMARGFGTVAAVLDKTVHTATDTVLNVSSKLQKVHVEDVMESSLGMLENIGKATMSVIIDKDPDALSKKTADENADQASDSRSSSEDGAETQDVTFAARFQAHRGVAAMKELEELSSTSSRSAQSLLRALKPNVRQLCDADMEKVAAQFADIEDIDEDEVSEIVFEDLAEYNLATDEGSDLANKRAQEQEWCDALTSKLTAEPEKLHQEAESILKEVFERSLDTLAWYSASAVLQLKEIAAKLLDERDTLATDVSAITTRAECVRQLVQWHSLEISQISSLYANTFNAIRDQFEKVAGSTPDDKVKMEVVDDHVSMHTTDVFLEAGTATSHTTDAFQLLMPVFRVLVSTRK